MPVLFSEDSDRVVMLGAWEWPPLGSPDVGTPVPLSEGLSPVAVSDD